MTRKRLGKTTRHRVTSCNFCGRIPTAGYLQTKRDQHREHHSQYWSLGSNPLDSVCRFFCSSAFSQMHRLLRFPMGRNSLTKGGMRWFPDCPKLFCRGGGLQGIAPTRITHITGAPKAGAQTTVSGVYFLHGFAIILAPFCGYGNYGTGFASCPGQ